MERLLGESGGLGTMHVEGSGADTSCVLVFFSGGVAQYFGNRGLGQWDAFSRLAAPALPSFTSFAIKIDAVVGRSAEAYGAVIESGADLDACYREYQIRLVTELRLAVRPPE
jgi:hypothetical protein